MMDQYVLDQLRLVKKQRNHSKLRVAQRYGVSYSKCMKQTLVKNIQEGSHAVFLRKPSNHTSIFAVFYEGEWFAVLYDRITKEISTFLPRNFLYLYRRRISNNN